MHKAIFYIGEFLPKKISSIVTVVLVECLFIEAAIHQMAFSANAQLFLIFKTVSRISVALLHPKFLMI
jgi:hypothetical protein